jgi:hypothetical protein
MYSSMQKTANALASWLCGRMENAPSTPYKKQKMSSSQSWCACGTADAQADMGLVHLQHNNRQGHKDAACQWRKSAKLMPQGICSMQRT